MTKEELFNAIDLAIRTNVVTYEEIVAQVHPNGTVQTEYRRQLLAQALA